MRTRRTTALIKSNNPHLAGGEFTSIIIDRGTNPHRTSREFVPRLTSTMPVSQSTSSSGAWTAGTAGGKPPRWGLV